MYNRKTLKVMINQVKVTLRIPSYYVNINLITNVIVELPNKNQA